MAGSKEKSEKNVTFLDKPKGHMFGKQTAGAQKPGTGAHDVSGGDAKFAQGGKGKMFGFRPSMAAEAGRSAPDC